MSPRTTPRRGPGHPADRAGQPRQHDAPKPLPREPRGRPSPPAPSPCERRPGLPRFACAQRQRLHPSPCARRPQPPPSPCERPTPLLRARDEPQPWLPCAGGGQMPWPACALAGPAYGPVRLPRGYRPAGARARSAELEQDRRACGSAGEQSECETSVPRRRRRLSWRHLRRTTRLLVAAASAPSSSLTSRGLSSAASGFGFSSTNSLTLGGVGVSGASRLLWFAMTM